jgi:protein-disulfide isomerase
LKQLQKLLADNLRIVFRHFPVETHPHSLRAAEASEAAGAQEKFWQMHDELFTHQTALEDDLSRYARRIGLGEERFANDMKENTFLEQIEAGYQHSLFDEHVTGTPTIYLNGIRYTGATDFDALLPALKQADTEGRIQLPEGVHGLRSVLSRLRRGASQ